jgi:hypothetical protein
MKILKIALAMMLVVLIVAAAYLYKGDLPAEYVDKKYSNDESQFLTMENGAKVHYRDEGDETKPVIVLVHGSNASLHTWEPWVEIFKADYRVISMDLPAHGLTGATPDKDYSSQAQVNTVQAVVSHLDVDTFVLAAIQWVAVSPGDTPCNNQKRCWRCCWLTPVACLNLDGSRLRPKENRSKVR